MFRLLAIAVVLLSSTSCSIHRTTRNPVFRKICPVHGEILTSVQLRNHSGAWCEVHVDPEINPYPRTGICTGCTGRPSWSTIKYCPLCCYRKKNLDYGSLLPVNPAEIDLTGTWELNRTILISGQDTLIQKPLIALWTGYYAKPPTTILFDSLQTFRIDQWCLKCPLIQWKGIYELIPARIDNTNYTYLRFNEYRDSLKNGESFTAAYSGVILSYWEDSLDLVDHSGCHWIYHRK